MCRTCGPLNCGMCLQKEIPIASFGDSAVNNSAVLQVGRAIGVFFLGWIKPGTMTLADNDYTYMGHTLLSLSCWVDLFTCFAER